jgi:hypothetical protein
VQGITIAKMISTSRGDCEVNIAFAPVPMISEFSYKAMDHCVATRLMPIQAVGF